MKKKLDQKRVRCLFSLFSDLEGEALERRRALWEGAARRLEGRLRPAADPRRHMERLCMTAAALAYSEYLTLGGEVPGGQVRVGEIALGGAETAGADAAAIREHFLAEAADLLLPERPAALLLPVEEA